MTTNGPDVTSPDLEWWYRVSGSTLPFSEWLEELRSSSAAWIESLSQPGSPSLPQGLTAWADVKERRRQTRRRAQN